MRALPATAPAAPPPPLTLDNLALALRGALSPAADVRVPYEAALQAWEAAPGLYASALLKVYESNGAAGGAGGGVPEPERLLAVLCLKAVVNRRWNERRPGDAALSDSEKADVRARLLRACDEKEGALAAQLILTMASIARLEGLAAWPELLPNLTSAALRTDPAQAARGMAALYRVIKLQAARRLLPHRRAFFSLAAQLHLPISSLRSSHGATVFSAAASPSGAEWLTAAGAPVLRCALLALKIEVQLLLHGYAQPQASEHAADSLQGIVAAAAAAAAADRSLRAAGASAAAEAVLSLALVAAKTILQVQDLHPLAFGGHVPSANTLAAAMKFACRELASRPFSRADGDPSEKFLVRLLLFLGNAATCAAYAAAAPDVHQPHGRPPNPHAAACDAAVRCFLESESLRGLVLSLVTRALPLDDDERMEYESDPETFVWEEAVSRESANLRRCAEKTLASLANIASARQAVQSAVNSAANRAAEAVASNTTDTSAVLMLDGAYAALAVVHGASEAPALVRVMQMLQQHCAAAPPPLAHLLRRRAAWLLGTFLSAPVFCRGSGTANIRGAAGARVEELVPWYMLLGQLLNDSHPGVTLTAAVALRRVVESADAAPQPPEPLEEKNDPLVGLSRQTLLPILRLALSARELDSRWRLTALIQCLLEHCAPEVGDHPATDDHATARAAAMADWLPAAWESAGDAQLLREALLDVGASALRACASQTDEALCLTCLNMVSAATSPMPGGETHPMGLVENAFKLWRAAVALRGGGSGGVGQALVQLAGRLPEMLDLGAEMVRPVMQLLDWYMLRDATGGCCGGSFIATHAQMLSGIFQVAVSESRGDRNGTLAALSAMHTLLMVAPAQAAVLQPALAAGLRALLLSNASPNSFSDLTRADLGGVAGRTLLTNPPVFAAALSAAGGSDGGAFAHAWLAISDSILLSSARRLAALSLVSLLSNHPSSFVAMEQILSFCVSVLAEEEQAAARPMGRRPTTNEHALFAAAVAPLDPFSPSRLPLKPALQRCLARAAELHSQAFHTAISRVDASVMQQAVQALGL